MGQRGRGGSSTVSLPASCPPLPKVFPSICHAVPLWADNSNRSLETLATWDGNIFS